MSGLTAGAILGMTRPDDAMAQAGKETHPASARVLDQLRTRFTFQISVDVATLQQGLEVAKECKSVRKNATCPVTPHKRPSSSP